MWLAPRKESWELGASFIQLFWIIKIALLNNRWSSAVRLVCSWIGTELYWRALFTLVEDLATTQGLCERFLVEVLLQSRLHNITAVGCNARGTLRIRMKFICGSGPTQSLTRGSNLFQKHWLKFSFVPFYSSVLHKNTSHAKYCLVLCGTRIDFSILCAPDLFTLWITILWITVILKCFLLSPTFFKINMMWFQ